MDMVLVWIAPEAVAVVGSGQAGMRFSIVHV